ncbi:MAG: hypothetical protein ABL916_23935 [Burkholderiaceae bacterium]
MSLMKFRFVLGVGALGALVILAGLMLFFGRGLDQYQQSILMVAFMALVAEVKASSAYLFDGTPKTGDANEAPTTTPKAN